MAEEVKNAWKKPPFRDFPVRRLKATWTGAAGGILRTDDAPTLISNAGPPRRGVRIPWGRDLERVR
jgi:hypothetical protein